MRASNLALVIVVVLLGCGARAHTGVASPETCEGAEERTVRAFIIAMSQDDSEASFDALLALTGSHRANVAAVAATALGLRRDERARPTLEALLDSAHSQVRRSAVWALRLLDPDPSIAKLKALREIEESPRVIHALDDILGRPSDQPLDGPPPTWARPGFGRPVRFKPM